MTGSLTTIAVNDHQQNRNKQHQSSKESAGLRGHDFGDACLQDGDKLALEPWVTFEPEHVSWAGMGQRHLVGPMISPGRDQFRECGTRRTEMVVLRVATDRQRQFQLLQFTK